MAESAASGTRRPILPAPRPHRKGGQGLPPPQLCALSAQRLRFPSRCLDLGPRGAQFGQPRGEPQLAYPYLARLRAREVAGVPISPGFLARTVTGEAATSASLGLRGRPSSPTAAPGAPPARRAAPGGGQFPPVRPARRAPAAAPSLAPPPSVNTVAARPPQPDAQVETGGAGRHRRPRPAGCPRPAPRRRAPTPRPVPGSRDARWRR